MKTFLQSKMAFLLLYLSIITSLSTNAQSVAIDPTFNPTDNGFGFGGGFNNSINCSAVQADGKLIVGGRFSSYSGTEINRIARFNTDGNLDTTFNLNVGSGPANIVNKIVLLADGKMIVTGTFTSFSGYPFRRMARLHSNGSIDTTFNSGTGPSHEINAIAIQSDGKIIIAGAFNNYNSTSITRIARLNADGTLDLTFNPGTGPSNNLNSTAIQSDGKIIIGGSFTSYNGTLINRIARLNANGSLDLSFNPGTGFDGTPLNIIIQADEKIVIGGQFNTFNNTSRNRIIRLNANGSLDATFNPGTGASGDVRSTAIQSDGKILIGGSFIDFNGTAITNIARINANGSFDSSFNPSAGPNDIVSIIEIVANDQIYIGGGFVRFNGIFRNRIARLFANGSLDPNFLFGTGANGSIIATAVQPNGKILIGGTFSTFNNTNRNYIARLNEDGTLDTTFNPGTGFSGNTVSSIAVQNDGKIYVVGGLFSYNNTPLNGVVRLNENGTIDTSFFLGTGANNQVNSVVIQPDGKILIGGFFSNYIGLSRAGIVRLNQNGTLDPVFNLGTGTHGTVFAITLQDDGKIIIGGNFTSFNGTARNQIARINTNGTLDTTFNPGTGPNIHTTINTATIQEDGKILIGGDFTSFNGTPRNRIARLNANGSLDTTFNVGTGASHQVRTFKLLPNGKIFVGGAFFTFNGTPLNNIVILNSNGSIDSTFNLGTGASSTIWTSSFHNDGKILIGGLFTSFNGVGRNRIARLNINTVSSSIALNNFSPTNLCRTDSVAIPFIAEGLDANNQLAIELSDSLGSFVNARILGSFAVQNSGQVMVYLPQDIAAGSGYTIRLTTTTPSLISSISAPFSIGVGCNNISTQLQTADCNRTNFLLGGPAGNGNNVVFASSGIAGVVAYRFYAYDANDQNLLGIISTPTRFFNPIDYSIFAAATNYVVRVQIETAAGLGPLGNPCTIGFRSIPTASEVPNIQINQAACASTNYNLQSTTRISGVDFINAVRNNQLSNYEFEVRDVSGTQVLASFIVPSGNLYLRDHASIFIEGTSYQVRVRGYMGPTAGNWSAFCNISVISNTIIVPATQVRVNLCGTALFTIATNSTTDISGIDFIIADRIATATAYEFEVRNANQTIVLDTITSNISAKIYPRNYTSVFQWGTTYQIRVRTIIGDNKSAWSAFCSITTQQDPANTGVPTTRIRQCGATITNNLIRANDVASAAQYRFLFYTDAACSQLYATAFSNVNLNLTNVAPGLLPSTTYYVLVNASVGSIWGTTGLGDTCSITTASVTPRFGNVDVNGERVFGINAYPNPFVGSATVVVTSTTDAPAILNIYDIAGKLISSQQVAVNQTITIGNNLAAGHYIIEAVRANTHKATFRLAKTN